MAAFDEASRPLISELARRHRERIDQWMHTVLVRNGISGTLSYKAMAEEAVHKGEMTFHDESDRYVIRDKDGRELGELWKIH